MGWIIDFLMGGPKPPEWIYVGHTKVGLTVTRPNRSKDDFEISIGYFMTPSGERKIKIANDNKDVIQFIERSTTQWSDAKLWQAGGPFPKTFEEHGDTLGEMLSRLIDKRILSTTSGRETER